MTTDAHATILVVDDEEYLRRVVARTLQEEGYACTEAASGPEALDALAAQEFALVVTDIKMPGMSGVELLAAARQLRPDVAVIMLTGVDSQETAVQALELGAYGYMIKPVHANELLINVINALRRRDLEKLRDEYEHQLERDVRERTSEIRRTQEEITLRLVSASGYRDEETGAHIRRMGEYAAVMAQALGWSPDAVSDLRLAAPMHDVGKIGVPDAILRKPGKLTDDEFNEIKKHTTIGAGILEGSKIAMVNLARNIALQHHEKWTGGGYPLGLRGEDISLSARIVAVCDVYDALVSDRVYRPAMPEDKALGIMKEGRGTHFDPDILDRFMNLLPEFHRVRQELPDKLVGQTF